MEEFEVDYRDLVPGNQYYIYDPFLRGEEDTTSAIIGLPIEQHIVFSGKAIGTFVELSTVKDIPFANFKNIQPLEGAKLETGLGSISENQFSTLNHKFYESASSPQRILKDQIVRQRMGVDDISDRVSSYLTKRSRYNGDGDSDSGNGNKRTKTGSGKKIKKTYRKRKNNKKKKQTKRRRR
jgi:hypothetical protein